MDEENDMLLGAMSAENRANRITRLYESAQEEIETLRSYVLHLLYCPKQDCSYCSQVEKEFRNERA